MRFIQLVLNNLLNRRDSLEELGFVFLLSGGESSSRDAFHNSDDG